MLSVAALLAPGAGVTRLAELTHLDHLGFPVFQAIRPRSRSLSTSMGRGTTRRGAIVSALLEAVETDVAEKATASFTAALHDLGDAAVSLWSAPGRDPLAIRLDPAISRRWKHGVELTTGRGHVVPLDLISQDLTIAAPSDAFMSTVGLASGGSRDEAIASALTELLEHDLETDWRQGTPTDRRSCEINLNSVNDRAIALALARVQQAGCELRLWSLGQNCQIAAILCFIGDGRTSATRLPPVAGSGCHADRTVATLRAIQEAAQARCALLSGARDDIPFQLFEHPRAKTVEALLASLCFGPGPLDWHSIPTLFRPDIAQSLHAAAHVAKRRSSLPLIVNDFEQPHPALHIVKVTAPGLRISERGAKIGALECRRVRAQRKSASSSRLLFVGPSLGSTSIPGAIELRPPAIAGDLARLLSHPPAAIGLVDGCFETAPSVWHKEILDLLAAGVVVMGAASIGALRAAELHDQGMRGIGAIFSCFHNRTTIRDDAVMVVHAPAELGYHPLTLSLVEAEAAIHLCCHDPSERRMLLRIARTLSFRQRDWAAILAAYHARTGRRCRVAETALRAVPSLKQADVRLLVDAMLAPLDPRFTRRPPLTSYYQRLLAQISSTPG